MEAEAFLVCFENHRADGLVWGVRTGTHWAFFSHLDVRVPMQSVYKGTQATQPVAYFEGVGVVTTDGHRASISPAPVPMRQLGTFITCPCGTETLRSRGRTHFLTERTYWECSGCLRWFSLDS